VQVNFYAVFMKRLLILLATNILAICGITADNFPLYSLPDTMDVCEGTVVNISNLSGFVIDPEFTLVLIYNGITLPAGTTHISTVSGLNVLALHTFKENLHYWDTIFVNSWVAPYFVLANSDTLICQNKPIELYADFVNCDTFYWENDVSHSIYPNGTVLNCVSDSSFTAYGFTQHCDPKTDRFTIGVIPDLPLDSIHIWLSQTHIVQCFGTYCTFNLNSLIETDADMIPYAEKKWILNGIQVDSIVNSLPAPFNTYTLHYNALVYKMTDCGLVTGTVSKILELIIEEPSGGCSFQVNGIGDEYLSCQPTNITITHNHVSDIYVFAENISVVSAQGNDISQENYNPETGTFQCVLNAFLDDILYVSIPYYDSCYRAYCVFQDTIYFHPKQVSLSFFAEYCIGSAIHIYAYANPDTNDWNFYLDSLIFGNNTYHFILVGGHSRTYLHYSSEEPVSDYLDGFTIPVQVVTERCGYLDTAEVEIIPALSTTCYPYIATNQTCYGDTTVVTVIERRYDKSYIKSLQFDFTDKMPIVRVDTLVYANGTIDSTRYLRYYLISYELLQNNFTCTIVYSDNGKETDTIIYYNFTLKTNICRPQLDAPVTCPCYTVPLQIINQNVYGHILSVNFYADDSIEYNRTSASSSIWNYSFKTSVAQTIYADICYKAGDSTVCYTDSFAPINPILCVPHLDYFDGRACLNDTIVFTFVSNEFFAYHYEYADWNCTTPVRFDSINGNYLYFSTIASRDIIFDVTFYFTDCTGDTIKYRFSDAILAARYVNIFDVGYIAVCEENTANLLDYVNECISELYCWNCTLSNTVQIPQGLDSMKFYVRAHSECNCDGMPYYLDDTIIVYRDKPGTVVVHPYDSICEGSAIQLKCNQIGVYDYVTWVKNGDTLAKHLPYNQSIIMEIVDVDAWYKVICDNSCYPTSDSFYLHAISNPPSEVVVSNVCPDRPTTLMLKWNGACDSSLTHWVYLEDSLFSGKLYLGDADTAIYEYFTYMTNGCMRHIIDTFYTAQLPNIQIVTDYAEANDSVVICLQDILDGKLTLHAVGGLYYQWLAPPEYNDDMPHPIDSITITTVVDNVLVIGVDSNTCQNIAILHVITDKDFGTPNWGSDSSICKYYPVYFIADTSLWYNTYTWISPNNVIYNSAQVDISRFEVQDSGRWTLLTAHANCIDTSFFRLKMKYFEDPIVDVKTFYCEHDTIVLCTKNNDGYSFYWYRSDSSFLVSTDNSIVFYDASDNVSGNYYLQVETKGCYYTTPDFPINIHKIRLNLPDSAFICMYGSTEIGLYNPNFTYLWNTGKTSAIISITEGGIYSVRFTDNECSNTDSILVTERWRPYFHLGNDTIICEEDEIFLYVDVPDSDNIVWQDGSHDNPYSVTFRDTYIATVERNECIAFDTIVVKEKFCRPLYFPTAFMPNSTIEENRIFKVVGTVSTDLIEYQMVIYDKSGQLVFQTNDPNIAWDGNFNGNPAPPAAYAYKVQLLSIADSKERQYVGTILLLR
jgi:gliding motility-associated-like protein